MIESLFLDERGLNEILWALTHDLKSPNKGVEVRPICYHEHDIAKLLKVSIKTLKRYCKKGYFRTVRLGANIYFLHHTFIEDMVLLSSK